ncbi:Hypothetical predicted protein [Pelobates cultripes]|uniref:Uncharacterized protein n=1 Tax=Pelobates cultripes TaxID=61616 RepID=A0AAD1W4T8_PELCU|nr:Hypothetical predicted protein [Pelobates cultripes]
MAPVILPVPAPERRHDAGSRPAVDDDVSRRCHDTTKPPDDDDKSGRHRGRRKRAPNIEDIKKNTGDEEIRPLEKGFECRNASWYIS